MVAELEMFESVWITSPISGTSEVYKRNADIQDELVAWIRDSAARKNLEFNWEEKHAILAHELQSVLRLTVGIYEHLLWTVTDLSLLRNTFVI